MARGSFKSTALTGVGPIGRVSSASGPAKRSVGVTLSPKGVVKKKRPGRRVLHVSGRPRDTEVLG